MSSSFEVLPQLNSFPFQTNPMESNKNDLSSVLENGFPLEVSTLNQPNNGNYQS